MRVIPVLGLLTTAPALTQSEADYYTVEHYSPPREAVRLEVGGMDFLSDGRLVVSTRRGQVWILEDPLVQDVADARWTLFAEGLWEGLGLNVVDDQIYVIQRGELSRLRDVDGDGTCDHVDTIADGWGLSENYHEFAYGLPADRDGNFVVTLNLAFIDPQWWHGQAVVPYRGWALKISPEGAITPFAHGFRSPCGVGRNAEGEIFVTDNQGDWRASSPIYHLVKGGFYGHPASLNWTEEYLATGTKASDTVPPPGAEDRRPPAIWIPYEWSRSTGNLVSDTSGGRFGPFERQLFVAELTNGMLLRAGMERVRGEYQGWIAPFRHDVGSVNRVAFGPDGSLFCGLTNRGWGGKSPADGLARVRWTGVVPMEVADVRLVEEGFAITFTHPIADGWTPDSEGFRVEQYDYNYWWEYGSPETNRRELRLETPRVSPDRRTLTLGLPDLESAAVARVKLPAIPAEGAGELLHRELAYTVNQLPHGEPTRLQVTKIVPPPPGKESQFEGWLMLTWVDPTALWSQTGWEACDVELDPEDRRRLRTLEGAGALLNTGERSSHFVSRPEFGDVELHLGFMLPEGGNSGVYLMGRYEVQLLDSTGVQDPGFGDCGGIYRGQTWPGRPPRSNTFKGAGEWHDLDLVFRTPRFDEQGQKVADARFERVAIDGAEVHLDVEVSEPTIAAMFPDEAPLGPLMFQGDHGPVAYRDVRVKPLGEPPDDEGWEQVFPEQAFDDWIADGDGEWELDGDVIVSSGPRGHLFSPRDDYRELELRAAVKVSDGGNSGLYFRATPTGGWPVGYEAQVNSTHPDPVKTGSLYGLAVVSTQLIPPDTWFDYHVTCREEEAGTHITISVNGVLITDHVDPERRYRSGHVALQQHHEGSVVQFRDVRVRVLD